MRNFFKDANNNVFEYDDEQVAQGYGEDLTSITEEEMIELTTPILTDEDIYNNKWNTVYNYWDNSIPDFTATETSNVYSIKSSDLNSLEIAASRLSNDDTIFIVQSSPLSSFETTIAEVKMVLTEAEKLRQVKVLEVFGE